MSTAIALIRRSTAQPTLHRLSAGLQLGLICTALIHVSTHQALVERLAALAFSH